MHERRDVNNKWHSTNLENVLYVPSFKKNLFSIEQCTDKKFRVLFSRESIEIYRNDQLVVQGVKQENKIHPLFLQPAIGETANIAISENPKSCHLRLGHLNRASLKEMTKKKLATGIDFTDVNSFFCDDSQFGKRHKLPFKKDAPRGRPRPRKFIHCDVSGPMSTQSVGGAKFFVTFKDDYSGFRHAHFMRH